MIWTTFEIAINIFQGFLFLMFVKQSFTYEKNHPVADGLLVTSCPGLFTLLLFYYRPYMDQLVFAFPIIYALTLSSEKKLSIVYWLAVMALLFNMISMVTYPIFELLPKVMHFQFPTYHTERFFCIITTNLLLFIAIKLLIKIKKGCSSPGTSSYAVFIIILAAAFIAEESLYSLYLAASDETIVPFFWIYIGLILFTMMTVILFYIVSGDSDRKSRYQSEIAMLSMTKQHQHELSQMYETLTARQHDYKHHLQTLEQLVSGGSPTAKEYLESIAKEAAQEDMIVTGSPEVDALLTAKRRTMHEKGIEFKLTPYPLASLPIATADFCAILGNLLDNAIEGIQRIAEPSAKPLIHLTFSRSWDMFYVYCTNPCEPSTLVEKKGLFLTSKKKNESELHGIGLHSIKAIAERAEGRAEFHIEDNEFHAKVVLPFLKDAKK